MSQTSSTVNFLIHDANGHPQMVKVVQNTTGNQPIAQIKLKPNPVKVIKLPTTAEGTNKAPVFRTVKLTGVKCGSKLLQVPIETFATNLQNIKVEPEFEVQTKQENQKELKFLLPTFTSIPKPVSVLENFENQVTSLSSLDSNSQGTIGSTSGTESQSTSISTTEGNIRVTSAAKNQVTKIHLPVTMSHASRRRHDSDNDPPAEYTTKRRKHADKVGKGLRHFSMKVCEKVRNKGFTSYNEVADELVLEFAAGMHGSADSQQYDQKNIRRRVYDALNVLMAMNIISKEKKEIRWLGLPTNSVQECTSLEKEKQSKIEQIQKKTQQLQELILQHISFKSLIERNKEAESKGVKPSPSSAIHLPFIVVNTSDKALIDCSISNDKTEYMFNFNKRFQIHDDIDILKRMGLLFGLDKGECSEDDIEKAKNMVPKSLKTYVEQMGRGVIGNLASIIDDDELQNEVEADTLEDGEAEAEDEAEADAEADADAEPNEYSDDSSDVDV